MTPELDSKFKNHIEALASIADFITSREVLDESEIAQVNDRLDIVLANINEDSKFFKRLL